MPAAPPTPDLRRRREARQTACSTSRAPSASSGPGAGPACCLRAAGSGSRTPCSGSSSLSTAPSPLVVPRLQLMPQSKCDGKDSQHATLAIRTQTPSASGGSQSRGPRFLSFLS